MSRVKNDAAPEAPSLPTRQKGRSAAPLPASPLHQRPRQMQSECNAKAMQRKCTGSGSAPHFVDCSANHSTTSHRLESRQHPSNELPSEERRQHRAKGPRIPAASAQQSIRKAAILAGRCAGKGGEAHVEEGEAVGQNARAAGGRGAAAHGVARRGGVAPVRRRGGACREAALQRLRLRARRARQRQIRPHAREAGMETPAETGRGLAGPLPRFGRRPAAKQRSSRNQSSNRATGDAGEAAKPSCYGAARESGWLRRIPSPAAVPSCHARAPLPETIPAALSCCGDRLAALAERAGEQAAGS